MVIYKDVNLFDKYNLRFVLTKGKTYTCEIHEAMLEDLLETLKELGEVRQTTEDAGR